MTSIARGKQVSNGHGHHSRQMHYQLNGYIDHAGIFYRALLKELSDPESELWMKKADLLKAQFIERFGQETMDWFTVDFMGSTFKQFAENLQYAMESDDLKKTFIEKYDEAAFVQFSEAHTEETYKEFAQSLKSYLGDGGHSPG